MNNKHEKKMQIVKREKKKKKTKRKIAPNASEELLSLNPDQQSDYACYSYVLALKNFKHVWK